MTNIDEISRRINSLFSDRLNRDVPSNDIDLLDSGTLDSLALVNLLVLLEEEFDVAVDLGDVELDSLRTVLGISQLVQSFLAEEPSSQQDIQPLKQPVM